MGTYLHASCAAERLNVLSVAPGPAEGLKNRIADFSNNGQIQGVYFLPALDKEAPLKETSIETWQIGMEKTLYALETVMRTVPTTSFLICATSLGGLHGYASPGANNPLGGGVSGFAKALSWERAETLMKVVDFSPEIPAATIANRLIEETLNDPGVVEVGWEGDVRFGIALLEKDRPGEVNIPPGKRQRIRCQWWFRRDCCPSDC